MRKIYAPFSKCKRTPQKQSHFREVKKPFKAESKTAKAERNRTCRLANTAAKAAGRTCPSNQAKETSLAPKLRLHSKPKQVRLCSATPPGKARQRCRATSKTAELHLHSNAPLKPDSKRSSTTTCGTKTHVSRVRQNQTRQPIERLQGRAIPQRRTARNNSAFTEHGLSTTA